jgi:hypothetical protein
MIADAMYHIMGPFVPSDIANACAAWCYKVEDSELAFRIATHPMIGRYTSGYKCQ